MMMKTPTHGTVVRTIDGKTHSAIWTVDGYAPTDLLYVAGQGDLAGLTETTQLGGSLPEQLVGQMLRELVKRNADRGASQEG